MNEDVYYVFAFLGFLLWVAVLVAFFKAVGYLGGIKAGIDQLVALKGGQPDGSDSAEKPKGGSQ